jgi:hypothetical protein
MSAVEKEQRPYQVVGISGSIRPGSYTTLAVALALTGAEELQCETKLINLRDYQLLFCDGKEDEAQFPKDVFRLRSQLAKLTQRGGLKRSLLRGLEIAGVQRIRHRRDVNPLWTSN